MGTNELRIEQIGDGENSVVLRVSGRIQAGDVDLIRDLLDAEARKVIFDLKEVTLVDRTAVRFLGLCERNGLELRECPGYIREWILKEIPEGL